MNISTSNLLSNGLNSTTIISNISKNARRRKLGPALDYAGMAMQQGTVMALAVLGNLFLIFVIIRGNRVCRRRISPVQLLLLHTCAADLLFAFLTLGTEIYNILNNHRFPGNDAMCKLMRYVQMFPLYASPFLLVSISADRFQAICRPLVNFRSSRYRRPNAFAAIAWIAAFAISIPQLFVWHKTRGICGTVYGPGPSLMKSVYVIKFSLIAWLIPSICAAVLYFCVCRAVWASSSKPRTYEKTKLESNESESTVNYINRLRNRSCGFRRQSSEFDRKRIQTVRLTLTIIACNFILYLPFCLMNFIMAFWPYALNPTVQTYGMLVGNLNACVNPWIYICFNRRHVAKALCGRMTRSSTDCHVIDRIVHFVRNVFKSSSMRFSRPPSSTTITTATSPLPPCNGSTASQYVTYRMTTYASSGGYQEMNSCEIESDQKSTQFNNHNESKQSNGNMNGRDDTVHPKQSLLSAISNKHNTSLLVTNKDGTTKKVKRNNISFSAGTKFHDQKELQVSVNGRLLVRNKSISHLPITKQKIVEFEEYPNEFQNYDNEDSILVSMIQD